MVLPCPFPRHALHRPLPSSQARRSTDNKMQRTLAARSAALRISSVSARRGYAGVKLGVKVGWFPCPLPPSMGVLDWTARGGIGISILSGDYGNYHYEMELRDGLCALYVEWLHLCRALSLWAGYRRLGFKLQWATMGLTDGYDT